MDNNVTKPLQIKTQCNEVVSMLIKFRKEAGFSQEFVSEWLGVSRKKLNEFENGSFDFDLMCLYCDKFSIDLTLKIDIN